MGTDYIPRTIIGIKVPQEKIYTEESIAKFVPCCDKKESPKKHFCGECGNALWKKESKMIPHLPYLQGETEDEQLDYLEELEWENETWQGLEVTTDTDSHNFFFGYVVGKEWYRGYGGVEFRKIPDIQELKDKLRKEFEPLGLWNEEEFGVWNVMKLSY